MSENYIPLYRKYRPQTLNTLVGQEHIKKTLTSAIELGKISHAYLFTGPRGTGKTSTARILAKSLNCKNGPTISPCGECASCKDITNTVPIDVIEIDAASNRSVEDTQNILEKIQYAPINGKFKIYIIDEVHMLSTTAFNALLKTLEEPPENVIFILATTEVHKVLDTIKSRCQRYDFRRITTNDIVKHLRFIADTEKINITNDALLAIAKNSAGGMRDSISLLDQLSIIGISKEITIDDVNSILGRISFDILLNLSNKIISSSPSGAIEILNDIYNSGNEPLQILTNLSEYFKNLLISKSCSKELLPELTGLNEPQINELLKQKEQLETHQIIFLIERTSHYIKELKSATNQHLWLEISIIDLANMSENSSLLELQNRITALEVGNVMNSNNIPLMINKPESIKTSYQTAPINENKPIITQQAKPKQTLNTIQEVNTDDFTPPPISKKPDSNDINILWQTLLTNINHNPTTALLRLATPVQISPEGIIIAFKTEANVTNFNRDESKKQNIIKAGNAMFNQENTPLTIKLGSNTENHATNISTNSKPAINKPAEEIIQTKQENITSTQTKEKNNIERIESDQEKMIIDLFDGKYIE